MEIATKDIETDVIYAGDCANMSEIPDDAIDLIISGPPYWSLIDYSAFTQGRPHLWQGTESYDQYLSKLGTWHQECFRVLRPGRYCIVVLGTIEKDGKTYPIPFDALPILQGIGFYFEYEIIWNKISGGRQSARNFIRHQTPGSYRPNIRTEYILVMRKDPAIPFVRSGAKPNRGFGVDVDDFFVREMANNIWNIAPRNMAHDKAHPCPFPIELPHRIVQLYSQQDEIVLDPFMGIGTTAKAAKMLGRKYIGYEKEEPFRAFAESALDELEGETISKMVCDYRLW